MDFKKRIIEIENETSKYENVKVIAATKYMNTDQTKALVEAGVKCLGENRTDLFLEKYEALKDYDIEWHFFGTICWAMCFRNPLHISYAMPLTV